jgi:hypothetical protein
MPTFAATNYLSSLEISEELEVSIDAAKLLRSMGLREQSLKKRLRYLRSPTDYLLSKNNLNFFDIPMVVFPCHRNGNHWVLYVFENDVIEDTQDKMHVSVKGFVIDSNNCGLLMGVIDQNTLNGLVDIIARGTAIKLKKKVNVKRRLFRGGPRGLQIPQQKNGDDCGAFVCDNIAVLFGLRENFEEDKTMVRNLLMVRLHDGQNYRPIQFASDAKETDDSDDSDDDVIVQRATVQHIPHCCGTATWVNNGEDLPKCVVVVLCCSLFYDIRFTFCKASGYKREYLT